MSGLKGDSVKRRNKERRQSIPVFLPFSSFDFSRLHFTARPLGDATRQSGHQEAVFLAAALEMSGYKAVKSSVFGADGFSPL